MPTILPIGPQVQFIDAAPPPATYDPAEFVVRLGALWLDITDANRPELYLCYASNPDALLWLCISRMGGDYKDNVFLGRDSGDAIAAGANGDRNVAIGNNAMKVAATAYQCVAVGYDALKSQTSGNYNTAIGHGALDSSTTAALNTAVGAATLDNATTGGSNTALGVLALQSLTTGSGNVGVGVNAGFTLTTENNCTLVGQGADISAGVVNAVALGSNARATESGSLALGSMRFIGVAGPVIAYLRVNINGTPLRIALHDV